MMDRSPRSNMKKMSLAFDAKSLFGTVLYCTILYNTVWYPPPYEDSGPYNSKITLNT